MDESAFRGLLEPGLRDAGYSGVYTNKLGKVAEGEAAFFRSDRYELAARRDVDFRAAFLARREADGPEDTAGSMAIRSPLSERYGPALAAFLEAHPSLREALQRVGTVAQLLLLRPRDPRHAPLCLVNTHLFFHNDAPHIRTLHTWAAVKVGRRRDGKGREEGGNEGRPTGFWTLQSSCRKAGRGPHGRMRFSVLQVRARLSDYRAPGSRASPPHVPCLQEACAFLQESANLVKDCELEPTLLFCGDMNSDLNDGIPGGRQRGGGSCSTHSDLGAIAVLDARQGMQRLRASPAGTTGCSHTTQSLAPLKLLATLCHCNRAGALQLLETGQLGADYWDWEAGVDFDWHRTGKNKGNSGDEIGEEDEGEPKGGPAPLPEAAVVRPDPAACGLDLSLAWPRPLRPAGDLQAPFSNYVSGYQGLLDYVWCV